MSDYTQSAIKHLSDIEHVRQRPAMYIGDVNNAGLHHLIYEVVDNSIDEALAGYCSRISVVINKDGTVSVEDNGRGIPVDIHEEAGVSCVELVLCNTKAGAKFEENDEAYGYSAGLHGVGVSCVNILSEWLEVEVSQKGQVHYQKYERAVPIEPLKPIRKTSSTGTKITFKPDPTIFEETTTFEFSRIVERLRDTAYLNPGLEIVVRDERTDEEEVFYSKKGLEDFVDYLNGSEEKLLDKIIYIRGEEESESCKGKVIYEAALMYNSGYTEVLRSYANGICTKEHGTHVSGFKRAFTTCFNSFFNALHEDNDTSAKKPKKKKKKKGLKRPSSEAYREGLVCIISTKIPEPQFYSQNKVQLVSKDLERIGSSIVRKGLSTWIEENPSAAKAILDKAIESQRVRDTVKRARELARQTNNKSLSGAKKLADCSSRNPEETEIYLVEGDSAGGSARQGRNADTQAILPLRGKILNVWKATPDKVMGHSEIISMISALGTGVLDEFDADKCRYHKIIIMCDADVDGSHIRTLLLTFLFRQMPALILRGYVYLACPPLYGLQAKGRRKMEYVIDDEEFARTIYELGFNEAVLYDEVNKIKIEGEALKELTAIVEELKGFERNLSVKNLSLKDYLDLKKEDRNLYSILTAYVTDRPESIRCFSKEEHDQAISLLRGIKEDLLIWREGEPFSKKEKSHIFVSSFKRLRDRLPELVEALKKYNLGLEDFFGRSLASQDSLLLDENYDICRHEEIFPFRLVNGKFEAQMVTLEELPQNIIDAGKSTIKVKRYKGLGEMNPDELWNTTMDPTQRTLKRVTMEDLHATTQTFSVLMGTKVEPRRDFIETNALSVKELDI